MRWSRTILSFLAIGPSLVSAYPISASTSLHYRSIDIINVPPVSVPAPGQYEWQNEKTRRRTLVARNEPVVLNEYDVGFLDPKGVDSKIYIALDAKDIGKRPKSDKSLRTTVAVRTSQLGPCFALAIVDDTKGGLLGHFTPRFCEWLEDPHSVHPKIAERAAFTKAALIKLLTKQYKKDLAGGEVYIVHGPGSWQGLPPHSNGNPNEPVRDRQAQHVEEILREAGVKNSHHPHRINVPHDNGTPGGMDQATFDKKLITLEQQPNRRLRLKMGAEVLRT